MQAEFKPWFVRAIEQSIEGCVVLEAEFRYLREIGAEVKTPTGKVSESEILKLKVSLGTNDIYVGPNGGHITILAVNPTFPPSERRYQAPVSA